MRRIVWILLLMTSATKHGAQGLILPKFPTIGLGSAESPDATAMAGAVHSALQNGIRLIDTAQNYGSEAAVGAGIARSGVAGADAVVVLAKVDLARSSMECPAGRMRRQVLRSRTNLGFVETGRPLDIAALHWPFCLDGPSEDEAAAAEVRRTAWRALEDLVDEGKVRALGVSNFDLPLLDELLAYAKHPPILNEIEFSPACSSSQQTYLVRECTTRSITVVGYSPYGTCWISKYYPSYVPWKQTNLLQHDVVLDIAAELRCTTAQVLLAYSVRHGVVPIPKSTQAGRVVDSVGALEVVLSDSQVVRLDLLNDARRGTVASCRAHGRIIAADDYEWEAT